MKKALAPLREFVTRADMVLLLLCCAASVFGVVVISSATASMQGSFVVVQIGAIVVGVGLYVLLTIIDVDILADKWILLYLFSVVLILLLRTPLGYEDETGNRAWLRFFNIGIQPSEVVKVLFIIVMAKHVSYLKEYKNLNNVLSVGQLLIHFGLITGLLVWASKDIGSALVYLFIFLTMLFVVGLRFYWFIIGLAGVAAVMPFVWDKVLTQRYRDRILMPYDPTIDPNGWDVRYQLNQSKLALASGRFTGTGLGQGPQAQSNALPAKHTDFIFSVIGEELGLIGCAICILLLVLIMLRCVQIGLRSKNTMNMLVCFGVAGSIFFQTFLNTGMCIGIAPVIGITLPFFSYGGSSMIALFAMMGLVSGIKFRPKPERYRRHG
jgi:rod shape determining protein RodA